MADCVARRNGRFIFLFIETGRPGQTEDQQMTKYITVHTGRAFADNVVSCGYRASVDANGTVRVYDDLARAREAINVR
jgi:hypothetical protein